MSLRGSIWGSIRHRHSRYGWNRGWGRLANKVQKVLGGQYGEMTVMTQYLFQGWSCMGPAKYKDMLLDIGTEEIGHVEMLCTLIAYLLEGAPLSEQAAAAITEKVTG